MKKLAVIGVLSLLVLTGCSKNSGPKTTVCKKEFMEEVRVSYKEMYDAVISKGVDIAYEVNVDQKQVIFKIILDYTVADLDELAALEIVDDVDSDYISLEASVDGFTAEGYTCE